MIYAETGMERMPEHCGVCEKFVSGYGCAALVKEDGNFETRPNWCPLREGKLVKRIDPEPDTAEKLLWLVKNKLSVTAFNAEWGKHVRVKKRVGEEAVEFKGKTLEEAINAAYEWAKEQENG